MEFMDLKAVETYEELKSTFGNTQPGGNIV